MLDQQTLFTTVNPFVRVINTTPVVWSPDVQIMFDVANYRLERNRALWFASKPDNYSTSTKHGTVVVPEGNSIRCAKESYERCRHLWNTVQSVPSVKHFRCGTDAILNAPSADTLPVSKCLCLDCLKRDLKQLVAERKDSTEAFHFSSDEEMAEEV